MKFKTLFPFLFFLLPLQSWSASGSFSGCSEFLNDQTALNVVGAQPSGKQILELDSSGRVNKRYSSEIEVENANFDGKGGTEYRFKPKDDVMGWIKSHPTEVSHSYRQTDVRDNFRDFVHVERDPQGRVTKVVVDNLTGGRGTTINGKRARYYRQKTTFEFGYDDKGCFPKKGSEQFYFDNQSDPASTLFDFEACQRFMTIDEKIPKTPVLGRDGKQMKNRRGVALSNPVFPPDRASSAQLVDIYYTLFPRNDDSFRSLAQGKNDRAAVRDWETLYSMLNRGCTSPLNDMSGFISARKGKSSKPRGRSGGGATDTRP